MPRLLDSIPRSGAAGTAPPLIDRELFFGDPEISGAQISPDGKFIAFIKPLKGTRNIWVKRTDEPFDKAKPITADTQRPIPQYFWSRDGKYILFVQDKGGDENYLVYAVNPADAPAAGQEVPVARNLTDMKGVRAQIVARAAHRSGRALRVHQRSRQGLARSLQSEDLDRRENAGPEKQGSDRRLDVRSERSTAPGHARRQTTATLRCCGSTKRASRKFIPATCLRAVDRSSYHKDGKRVYFITNKGADIDLTQIGAFRSRHRKRRARGIGSAEARGFRRYGVLRSHGRNDPDYLRRRPRTNLLERQRLSKPTTNCCRSKLPGKEIGFGSATKDEQLFLIDRVQRHRSGRAIPVRSATRRN